MSTDKTDLRELPIDQLREEVERRKLLAEAEMFDLAMGPTSRGIPMGDSPGSNGYQIIGGIGGIQVNEIQGATGFITETDHAAHRVNMRRLAHNNPFAANIIDNLTAYVVGSGLTYTLTPRTETPSAQETQRARDLTRLLREELDRRGYWHVEPEYVRRMARDGEALRRWFPDDKVHRFVEAGQVSSAGSTEPNVYFGVRCQPGDATMPVAYLVVTDPSKVSRPEEVLAAEMIHAKPGVDANVTRGVSLLWGAHGNLERAGRLAEVISRTTAIQGAIAMVRYHEATPGQVQTFVGQQAQKTATNPVTGQSERYSFGAAPKIIDATAATRYEFPAVGANIPGMVEAIQAELRAACAKVRMPEWMVTQKADAKYANAFVSEAPTLRMMEYYQAYLTWVLGLEIERHVIPATEGLADVLKLHRLTISGPKLATRDPVQAAQANEIRLRNGVLSPQTWAADDGLDYEAEQRQIDEHEARTLGANNGALSPTPPTPPPQPRNPFDGATQ